MIIEKYKNDGWGLSKKEFEWLYKLIEGKSNLNIVEFGSGRSTEFFVDQINETNSNNKIYSFDDSKEYAYKGEHPNLNLNIVKLLETTDEHFNNMFENKKYDFSKMSIRNDPPHTRQKNTFYLVDETMLPSKIDILVVDGPHGNGRSLAYLHCANKLVKDSIILIDDASHYPFYEFLSKVVQTEIIDEQKIRHDKWTSGGDYIICKVV